MQATVEETLDSVIFDAESTEVLGLTFSWSDSELKSSDFLPRVIIDRCLETLLAVKICESTFFRDEPDSLQDPLTFTESKEEEGAFGRRALSVSLDLDRSWALLEDFRFLFEVSSTNNSRV